MILKRHKSQTTIFLLKVGEQRAVLIRASVAVFFLLLWVAVKLTRIANTTLDRRHVRRVNVLAHETIPCDFGEPLVIHDVFAAAVQVTEALREVGGDELLQKILRVRVDIRRILYSALENVLVDLHRRTAIPKRGKAAQHLEDQNTQGPPVDGFVVALGCDNFWRKVIRGTAKSPGDVLDFLREAEIGNLQMTVSVEQQVLWLQIAIYDVARVQVVKSQRDFGSVELGDRIRKSLQSVSQLSN